MSTDLPNPSKIVCIGRNFAAHARELDNEVPESPVVFLKPTSSLIGSGGYVILPRQSSDIHHEVELVVEIGTTCRDVPEESALAVVRSYAVGLDMTARDLQAVAKEKRLPWTIAKGFDTFCPIGPLAPADGIDLSDLQIRLTVNGELRQEGSTALMLFPIPRLIAFCSSIFTLKEGDLIYTGTPKGVGPIFAGDQLVATISGLPELRVGVRHSD